MRRLYAWVAGAAGGLAAAGLLRRRRSDASVVAPEPPAGADPRAEELRAKLAEKDAASSEAAPPESDGAAAPESDAEPQDVDTRRQGVHERGRAAIDEMRGGD